MHRDIFILINVMCGEYCTFFKSFVSDRSQEIFILMSPIISEGTKDQRALKRWPLTWVEVTMRVTRESLWTQDYKDIWGRLSSLLLRLPVFGKFDRYSPPDSSLFGEPATDNLQHKDPILTGSCRHCWESPSQRHVSSCLHQLCHSDLRSQEQP